jgi:hypothetical protein
MKSFKYIKQLLERKSFPDFIKAVGMKVDLKEWTECIGMMNKVNEITKDKKIDFVFDIGCGKRPTLGILLALNFSGLNKVVCIDPQLDTSLASNVRGIKLFNVSLNDFLNKIKKVNKSFGNAVICCNHSHVSKKELYSLMDLCNNWTYITTPCCVDNRLINGLYYKDEHIWSPKNEIYTFFSRQ